MCKNHQEYMFASRGPVSTMPGNTEAAPVGMMCEDHPDRPATKRIQGETDSMGCEYIGLCDECYTAHVNHVPEPITGPCDWCKQHSDNLKPTRDYEEGSAGPVYDVCSGCRQRQNDAAAEELAYYDNQRGNSEIFDDGQDDGRDFHDDGPPEDDGFIELAPSNASVITEVDWRQEALDSGAPSVAVRKRNLTDELATLREKMIIKADPSLPIDGIPNVWPFPIRTK